MKGLVILALLTVFVWGAVLGLRAAHELQDVQVWQWRTQQYVPGDAPTLPA